MRFIVDKKYQKRAVILNIKEYEEMQKLLEDYESEIYNLTIDKINEARNFSNNYSKGEVVNGFAFIKNK